jgi:hypothetical protein
MGPTLRENGIIIVIELLYGLIMDEMLSINRKR